MNLWGKNGGVYFGFGADATEGAPPPQNSPLCYVGDRHLVTIGPNGSGKSRRILLPNLCQLTDWSMLVVDPKGELAYMTAEHRLKAGNNVILLNPFNSFGMGSNGFNPIAALDPKSDDFPDDALGLAEAIIRVEGKEPHWAQSAQDLVCALIMYSRLTAERTGFRHLMPDGTKSPKEIPIQHGDLGHVRWCLGRDGTDFGHVIRDAMDVAIDHDCEELYVKAARYAEIDSDNKEVNSILSTALTQTRWLDSRPIKRDLQKGNIDFGTMKKRPTVIYLILPTRRLGTHSTWLRLMITSVLQTLLKDTTKAECPVLLMLDEFPQLGHLPIIENTLALMRGYGVKMWAVLQDLSQAKALYEQRWESFIGNAGVLHSFAPQDLVTAEYLSKRTGQTTKAVTSWSQEHRDQTRLQNLNMSQTGVPLMLPQDLRDMDNGYFVMFSHKAKGTIRGYAPYPTEIPGMARIVARDPAA